MSVAAFTPEGRVTIRVAAGATGTCTFRSTQPDALFRKCAPSETSRSLLTAKANDGTPLSCADAVKDPQTAYRCLSRLNDLVNDDGIPWLRIIPDAIQSKRRPAANDDLSDPGQRKEIHAAIKNLKEYLPKELNRRMADTEKGVSCKKCVLLFSFRKLVAAADFNAELSVPTPYSEVLDLRAVSYDVLQKRHDDIIQWKQSQLSSNGSPSSAEYALQDIISAMNDDIKDARENKPPSVTKVSPWEDYPLYETNGCASLGDGKKW